jgi:O-antigen ligase
MSRATGYSTRGLALPAAPALIDADTLVRSVLFIAIFLSFWISFHPFMSLAEPMSAHAEGGDWVNQAGFSLLFFLLAIWSAYHEPKRLVLLLRPALLAMLAWCAISVVMSWEPELSARRLAFTLVVMSICAMALLLPKNLRHFGDLLATVTLITIAACYLGVLLAPQLSIHQATDFLEPQNAGSWRGAFPHKNEAGAMMNQFIFIGLFVARVRSPALGTIIVALAAIFLIFAQSKAAVLLLPLVLIVSAVIERSRRPATGLTLVIAILAAFNLFSVGSVYFTSVHNLNAAILPDPTFTGRTDVWEFALQAVAQRPIFGYGFSAFWGTPQVQYGLTENSTWVNATTDAHNAYLNLALTTGIPGLALVLLWIIILPILDFYRQPHETRTQPLRMLFLRACIYVSYASCFESSMFEQVAPWYLLLISAFGLRYMLVTRVTA